MDIGLLERCDGSMGENPPHQLGDMGEHCMLTICVWGRVPQTFSGWSLFVMRRVLLMVVDAMSYGPSCFGV